MKFTCVHCGQAFRISAEQFGSSGRCPHCSEVVHIPAAEEHPGDEAEPFEPVTPGGWLNGSISGMVSLVIHLLVFLMLAYFGWEIGRPGLGESVIISESPFPKLDNRGDEELANEKIRSEDEQQADSLLEPVAPEDAISDSSLETFSLSPPSAGGSSRSFDLGAVAIGGGGGGSGDWDLFINQVRKNGLDIVLVFDSTGSMGGEIREVKGQIGSIGNTLMALVPRSRISICTYRDEGDEYVVKGLPLTSDLQQVDAFLRPIQASGGSDYQEAVQEGLRWAVDNNEFRPRARKVILLFGDAPPHPQDKSTCLRIASDFNRQFEGVVSTVSCRHRSRLPDFQEIAEVGGGEAFLTTDRREIMTQLMVLVFGSRYRSKVIEAFRLMGE